MTNTKKRVFSGVLLTIFLFIITLGFFAYAFPKKEQGIAKADSVNQSYSYTGSNLFTFDAFMSGGNPSGWYPVAIRANFYSSYPDLSTTYASCDFYWWNSNTSSFDTSYSIYYLSGSSYVSGPVPLIANTHKFLAFSSSLTTANQPYSQMFPADLIMTGDFNGNVQKIRLYTSSAMTNMNVSWTGWKCFRLEYIDNNNNSIRFEFIMPSAVVFDDRTYYVNVDFPDNYSDGYDSGYYTGYEDGKLDNQQNIYNSGYSAGRTAGYSSGYSDGVASANNYSFIGLLGAVIDAPVNAFKSMFNFDVLGVNLLDFLLGLFTIGVTITIIKYIKGGR